MVVGGAKSCLALGMRALGKCRPYLGVWSVICKKGLEVDGGVVCRFNRDARVVIKYKKKVSMRLRVSFDRADLICLSSVDIVSLS